MALGINTRIVAVLLAAGSVAAVASAEDILETFDGGLFTTENGSTVKWRDGGSFIPWGPGVSGLLPGDHYESGQDLPDGQSSILNLTVMIGPSGGTFEFDYAVSSESTFDFFILNLDGADIFADSGTNTSTVGPLALTPGSHVISFRYVKDLSVSVGFDSAAIDNVSVTGVMAVPAPGAMMLLGLAGFGVRRRRAR